MYSMTHIANSGNKTVYNYIRILLLQGTLSGFLNL